MADTALCLFPDAARHALGEARGGRRSDHNGFLPYHDQIEATKLTIVKPNNNVPSNKEIQSCFIDYPLDMKYECKEASLGKRERMTSDRWKGQNAIPREIITTKWKKSATNIGPGAVVS